MLSLILTQPSSCLLPLLLTHPHLSGQAPFLPLPLSRHPFSPHLSSQPFVFPCLLSSLPILPSPSVPLTLTPALSVSYVLIFRCPSHPPSVRPASPWWYELMCQLSWSFPPAAVCQPQLSFRHVSLSLFLSFPRPLLVIPTASLLSTIAHSIMSAPPPPPPLSLSLPSLLPPSLLFPSETGLSGRFSHVSISNLMLLCLHVHVYLNIVSALVTKWGWKWPCPPRYEPAMTILRSFSFFQAQMWLV